MTEYVLGFAINPITQRVALIKKNRPEWQAGKWNGIGGRIEDTDESPNAAMEREFAEEAGVWDNTWQRFAILECDGCMVHIFRSLECSTADLARTKTDETVATHPIWDLPPNSIPNLKWLIPMALSFQNGERATEFHIAEVYHG